MAKKNDKLQNVVQMLSSIGVKVKKTKSRFDIMHTLPNPKPATENINRIK
ncbi:Lmo0850 family protein [Staphylococcus schleiferi]|nr:Lmo0850 family protein [Staphylococcus schleiferi]